MTNTTTTATATVNVALKADWFKADRKLAENVSDFMMRTLWFAEVRIERENIINKLEKEISGLKSLKGSIIWDNAKTPAIILQKEEELAQTEIDLDEWIKKAGVRWKASDFGGLTDFQKAYKKAWGAGTDLSKPVIDFFKLYKIDLTDTEDLTILVDAIRGDGMATMKTTVKSEGTIWTDARRDASKVMIRKLAEILIEKGTVKPAKVAPELKEKYTTTKKNKKNKKNKTEQKQTVNLKAEVVVPAHIEAQADEVANAPAYME